MQQYNNVNDQGNSSAGHTHHAECAAIILFYFYFYFCFYFYFYFCFLFFFILHSFFAKQVLELGRQDMLIKGSNACLLVFSFFLFFLFFLLFFVRFVCKMKQSMCCKGWSSWILATFFVTGVRACCYTTALLYY